MKAIEHQTMTKVWWRVVPLMAAGLLFNFLDRANISFAALQMNAALGFSNTTFGLGAGFLAVGILLFGIPSTLLLHHLGARRWISVTLVAWAVCSGATAFVTNAGELLGIRLLLGMAEAGFVPGAILYFSYWFPSEYRGRVLGSFVFMQPVGLIVGGPVSGALVSHGLFGLAGWQSMFIVEAIPTVLLALLVFCYLADRPADARWLSPTEKDWLGKQLAAEQHLTQTSKTRMSVGQTFANGRVWVLAIAYLAIGTSGTGAVYFIPLIIRSMDFSIFQTGFIAAVPPTAAALSLPLWGFWADRFRSREVVVATAASVFAAGLLGAAALLPSPWAIAPLSVAIVGFYGFLPTFWTLPYTFLTGASAAAGIAFINVTGNLGNFSGPYLVGWLSDVTGSYRIGLVCMAAFAIGAAAIMIAQAARHRNSIQQKIAAAQSR